MKALITGITGFLGSRFESYLTERGWEVLGVTRRPSTRKTHYFLENFSASSLEKFLSLHRVDAILHCAGSIRSNNTEDFYTSNTELTGNLLNAVEAAGLESVPFMLMGSAAEYGFLPEGKISFAEIDSCAPVSDYGKSKLEATQKALRAAKEGLNIRVVRIFNVLAPDMPKGLCVSDFLNEFSQTKEKKIRVAGSLSDIRDFIDLRDVLESAISLLLEPKARGQIINLCSGRGTRIETLLNSMAEILGTEVVAASQTSGKASIGCTSKLYSLIGKQTPRSWEESLQWILEPYAKKDTHHTLPSLQ